ncbi:MAG: rhodanese-related sulfurtransferase [Bacteroidetes bacterium]|nr:MAG: rhodanese-related sulfurtransferase [Bacteroidota bacterium]TAG87405.1 MAG: rhodanese-related sulfurtransferase [Bacteroidota bacterium]
MKSYSVLLYYCYTKIEKTEDFRNQHHQLCLDLNLRGRIIIANEGLNGTISGVREDCEKYMQTLKSEKRFENIDFKIEYTEKPAFQKLYVRVKDEIVHSSLSHINPNEKTGKYIEPQQFKEILKDIDKNEDVLILDVRSNYEHNVGKFKNALTLDIENFRDFPEKVKELENYKHKKIITYCTGGIKCEKASAYLLEKGFEDVYQLHGGIIKYGIEAGGENFEGKCYVFDERVVVDVNSVNPIIKSTCFVCGITSDRMVNCANAECNEHVPICEKCGWELEGACSKTCQNHPKKRPYNGTGYYQKELNGYDPHQNSLRKK